VTVVTDRLRAALADRYRLERELGRGASPTHLAASCLCKLSVRTPLFVVLAVAGVALAQRVIAQAPEPVDLVLHNGKVVTLDDRDRVTSALAIRDGKILAVGGESLVARYRAARVVDLRGRMAMPGFDDSHIHIFGRARRDISLAAVRSIRELQDSLRVKARLLGPGQWITGDGWAEENFEEQRLPVRADLDAAAPMNPVFLVRAGGHSSASNSLALRRAGITRDTPQPASGMIEHDAAGELTGIIRERSDLVRRLIPQATADELRPSFVQALRDLLALGITSIIQAGAITQGIDSVYGKPTWPEWERAYRDHRGELPRAAVQIYWRGADDLRAFGKRPGDGDEWLRVGALKLLVDGGFTGPSAYTLAPYKGMPGFRGTLNLSPDSLYQTVKAAHALGWQLGFHAIGDAAIQLTVDIFDRVLRESPRPDHRHYLNHFTMLPPTGTLATMARDSILVTTQPNFTYTLESRYRQVLDGTRLAHNNPLATPMRHGAFIAFSSDILPVGPMVGLYAAVTRKGKSGTVYGSDEAMPMMRALRAYTRNGAYLTREEHLKGTLEVGKLADIIVLSQDLLTIPPGRILNTKVDLTVLGGRVVYERVPTPTSATPTSARGHRRQELP
jgi:predicted amidohydrolase YtcJ